VSEGAEIGSGTERAERVSIRPVMLACSSKVQVPELLNILDNGVDGVEVVACPDEVCRFLVGSRRASKRVAYVRGLLDAAGLGAERLGISIKSDLSAEELVQLAEERAAAVRTIMAEGAGQ